MEIQFTKTVVNYVSNVGMKVIFTILSAFFLYQMACISLASENNHSSAKKNITADTIDFKNQVQPIFVKRCSPCHFTGGKMYEKLPFDEARTIINNQSGILRRIKDDGEKTLITAFLEKNKPESK